ncbi:MAG TPA: hypothetical protein VJ205_01070, partial [Gammaproteobacteria bacterium]|nr:hypothetical protein [Gammaproteobacteria bacterium]
MANGRKKNIEVNPDTEKAKFFNSLEYYPQSSVYILGNLYALMPISSSPSIYQAILAIHNTLTPSHIQKLVQTVLQFSEDKLRLLETANKEALVALKQALVEDKRLFLNISIGDMITLGQDIELTRQALIALIRQDIHSVAQPDPFETFDYHLLQMADYEQNQELLAPYIRRCTTVPLEAIKRLGQKDPTIAKIIMSDLSSYDDKYDLEAFFAACHPSLRSFIAGNWRQTLQSIPLTRSAKINLQNHIQDLSKTHSEFQGLQNESRP